ncbi:hypothetical protein [Pseudofulvibacter geojedonensis]|uniref:Uncharacterized protein n=1 Tax=Pseudofulvibacter geojedonensis TaxID=1123758 RepID=A0ABW3HYA5_9FLAO
MEKKPIKAEILYQNFIDKTISKGFNHISNYSFSYIYVLIQLSSKLKTTSALNQFKINFQKFYNLSFNDEPIIFDFLPIKKRREIIVSVNKMLMEWPNTFFKIHNLKKFNNSHIIDNLEKMPYWAYYYLMFKS